MRASFGSGLLCLSLVFALLLPLSASPQTPAVRKEADVIAAGYKPMPGPEIARMLLGNTAYFLFLAQINDLPAGTVGVSYYRDQRTRVRLLPGGRKSEGNWWVEGNLACGELAVQGHVCFAYYRVDATIYVCRQPQRICDVTLRVVPGNVEGL